METGASGSLGCAEDHSFPESHTKVHRRLSRPAVEALPWRQNRLKMTHEVWAIPGFQALSSVNKLAFEVTSTLSDTHCASVEAKTPRLPTMG